MRFNWREFLAFAQATATLSGVGFSVEAAQRSAVSRAYYAAFCHAREYATLQLGYSPSYTARDHVSLRAHLRLHGLEPIAEMLARLRIWRNRCDYTNQVANLVEMLRNALETSELVIHMLPLRP